MGRRDREREREEDAARYRQLVQGWCAQAPCPTHGAASLTGGLVGSDPVSFQTPHPDISFKLYSPDLWAAVACRQCGRITAMFVLDPGRLPPGDQ